MLPLPLNKFPFPFAIEDDEKSGFVDGDDYDDGGKLKCIEEGFEGVTKAYAVGVDGKVIPLILVSKQCYRK